MQATREHERIDQRPVHRRANFGLERLLLLVDELVETMRTIVYLLLDEVSVTVRSMFEFDFGEIPVEINSMGIQTSGTL